MLWNASCLVRDRTDTTGTFHLLFDLRQMHAPDAYFGNAHCLLSVSGDKLCVSSNVEPEPDSHGRAIMYCQASNTVVGEICSVMGEI